MEKEKIEGIDIVQEKDLKKAEQEIILGYKPITLDKFRGKENVEIHIYHPTIGEDSTIADAYAESYNRFLLDPTSRLISRDKIVKLLESKKLWTQEDEKAIEDLKNRMRDLMLKLSQLKSKNLFNSATEARFRIQLADIRSQLTEIIAIKQRYLNQTIEGRAEEDSLKLKLVLCTRFTDGSRVWNSSDDLNKENDDEKINVMKIIEEAILFWSGVSQEVLDNLPERIIDLFRGGDNLENLPELETGSLDTL